VYAYWLTLVQISDNNVEAAVNKYFETEPTNMQRLLTDAVPRWDETAFGSGRYGQDDTGGAQTSMSPPTSTAARTTWADDTASSLQY
jgi:hypothetical protein